MAEYHLDNTVFCRGSGQIQLSIGMSKLPKSCRGLSKRHYQLVKIWEPLTMYIGILDG